MGVIESLQKRRTYYQIDKSLPVSEEKVVETVQEAVKLVPDAFNMKSQRVIVALGEKQNQLCRHIISLGGEICCFYCGVRVHVIGREKLPTDGRFLLVANHRSLFDPLAIFHALRAYNIAFISKPSNMKLPVLGRIAAGDCFLPIDRENDREALKTILCAADYLKRDLCSICIYPEGTRSKTRQMLPFHHGSFKIAQRAHVPLVIAAISGTDMVKKNILRRRTDVYIDVLACIPAGEVQAETTAALSNRAYEAIAGALEKREGKA